MTTPIEGVDPGVNAPVAAPDNTARTQHTTAAHNGTAVTPHPVEPDFGPAATFTPSQELARLAATQQTSVLSAAEALAAAADPNGNLVGASAGSAFVPADFAMAKQFTMYNSTGIAVPLSQAVAVGAAPTAPPTTDLTTLQPPAVTEAIPPTPPAP